MRNHRGDRFGRGPLHRVNDDKKLHQVLVDLFRAGLDDDHGMAPDIIEDPGVDLAAAETGKLDLPFFNPNIPDDLFSQRRVGASGKNTKVRILHHGFSSAPIITYIRKRSELSRHLPPPKECYRKDLLLRSPSLWSWRRPCRLWFQSSRRNRPSLQNRSILLMNYPERKHWRSRSRRRQ